MIVRDHEVKLSQNVTVNLRSKMFVKKKVFKFKKYMKKIAFFKKTLLLLFRPFCSKATFNSNYLFSANQIQTIMTVRQIYTRIEGPLSDTSDQFTAVLFAMITHINLDLQSFALSKRW